MLEVHVTAAIVTMATETVALLVGVLKSRWNVHRLVGEKST